MIETLQPTTETKAIKEHKCSFCSETILIGEVYSKSTHIFDGRIYDWKSHKRCDKLACDLKMWDDPNDEGGLTQEDFVESIREAFNDNMISLLPKGNAGNSIILGHLRMVPFMYMYWHMIRYFSNLNK